jgi:hypothetical protein
VPLSKALNPNCSRVTVNGWSLDLTPLSEGVSGVGYAKKKPHFQSTHAYNTHLCMCEIGQTYTPNYLLLNRGKKSFKKRKSFHRTPRHETSRNIHVCFDFYFWYMVLLYSVVRQTLSYSLYLQYASLGSAGFKHTSSQNNAPLRESALLYYTEREMHWCDTTDSYIWVLLKPW